MRTLVDLGEDRVKALDRIARAARKSRAAIIRQALDDYLRRNPIQREKFDGFGLWGDKLVDGQEYQEKLRSEW